MAAIVIAFTALFGCKEDQRVMEKCEMFLSVYCDQLIACFEETALSEQGAVSHDECFAWVSGALQCEQFDAVSPRYDECVDTVANLTCDEFFVLDDQGELDDIVLPPACSDVFYDL